MTDRIAGLSVGDKLPERHHTPTNVSLFLYNAAIWNAHRIHFDETYTREVEKHPGIVVDGPLQGDWMIQTITDWLGEDGDLVAFEYSNRRPSYLSETLQTGGTVESIDEAERTVALSLFVRNESGDVIAPGKAVVLISR